MSSLSNRQSWEHLPVALHITFLWTRKHINSQTAPCILFFSVLFLWLSITFHLNNETNGPNVSNYKFKWRDKLNVLFPKARPFRFKLIAIFSFKSQNSSTLNVFLSRKNISIMDFIRFSSFNWVYYINF